MVAAVVTVLVGLRGTAEYLYKTLFFLARSFLFLKCFQYIQLVVDVDPDSIPKMVKLCHLIQTMSSYSSFSTKTSVIKHGLQTRLPGSFRDIMLFFLTKKELICALKKSFGTLLKHYSIIMGFRFILSGSNSSSRLELCHLAF